MANRAWTRNTGRQNLLTEDAPELKPIIVLTLSGYKLKNEGKLSAIAETVEETVELVDKAIKLSVAAMTLNDTGRRLVIMPNGQEVLISGWVIVGRECGCANATELFERFGLGNGVSAEEAQTHAKGIFAGL